MLWVLVVYSNLPMQHSAIFNWVKIDNFQCILIFFCFVLKHRIVCEYTLEPPQSMF